MMRETLICSAQCIHRKINSAGTNSRQAHERKIFINNPHYSVIYCKIKGNYKNYGVAYHF